MLTIIAAPRAFVGEFDVIQRNAIGSWTRLRPAPQVLLIGNEPGTADVCAELGVGHIPGVRVGESGAPFADSMLALAEQRAAHPLLLWVAADTVLFDDLMHAARQVADRFEPFCMVVGRYHVTDSRPIDFTDPAWDARLRRAAFGPLLDDLGAGDVFLFRRHFWRDFPPFIEGRGALDGWMFFRTLATGAALVDATAAVMTIHQDHGYGDQANRGSDVEAAYNRRLAGAGGLMTRDNANWLLTPRGLVRPRRSFRRHVAGCAYLAAAHPRLAWPLRAYQLAVDRLLLRPSAARADTRVRAAGRRPA